MRSYSRPAMLSVREKPATSKQCCVREFVSEMGELGTVTFRDVEIQCQWPQFSGAKSELGTTGLFIGNLLLSTSLKIITRSLKNT